MCELEPGSLIGTFRRIQELLLGPLNAQIKISLEAYGKKMPNILPQVLELEIMALMTERMKDKKPTEPQDVLMSNDQEKAQVMQSLIDSFAESIEQASTQQIETALTKVDKSIMYRASDANDLRGEVDCILVTEPEGASAEAIGLWNTMRPLDSSLFDHYFTKVSGPETPRLDLADTQFGKGTTMQGNPWVGIVTSETYEWHGVVRMVKPDGWISEKTYKHGKYHGLSRDVRPGEVRIILNKDGHGVASLVYDGELNLLRKSGQDMLLADITAEFLRGNKMGRE